MSFGGTVTRFGRPRTCKTLTLVLITLPVSKKKGVWPVLHQVSNSKHTAGLQDMPSKWVNTRAATLAVQIGVVVSKTDLKGLPYVTDGIRVIVSKLIFTRLIYMMHVEDHEVPNGREASPFWYKIGSFVRMI